VSARRLRGPALALLALVAIPAAAATAAQEGQVRVDARLVPDPVGLDETALLTVTIDADGLRLPEIAPEFELANLERLGAPSVSRSHSWVNGVTKSRLELSWRLRPLAAGSGAVVRSIRFEMAGVTRVVGDLSVDVVERAPPRSRRGQRPATPLDPFGGVFGEGGNDPFAPFRRRGGALEPGATPVVRLASEVSPARLYVGQQAVWTLAVETQTDVASFDLREQPDFAGFWSRPLELPERPVQREVEIDGRPGARFTLLARALFPLREGTYRIEPTRATVAARSVQAGLFGLLGRDEPRQLESEARTVVVRPLPAGAPQGFSGLVGRLELASELRPERIEAGAAATLRVRVSGDANFEGAPAPELRLPAGLRQFPPQREIDERRSGERLDSEVTWSWVVVGERPGRYPVPPVRLASFDPFAAEYRVAQAEVPTLEIVPASGDVGAAPRTETAGGAEAARPETGRLVSPTLRTGLSAGVLVAFLAALGLAVARLRERPGSPAGVLRRRIDAARAADSPRDAAKALEEAWRDHLTARFGVAPEVAPARWAGLLAERGVAQPVADELAAFAEDLHLLAFAPELADAEALRDDLVRRSRALARRLR
jgi:hypothetical protein